MIIYSIAGSWGQLLYFVLIGTLLFVLPRIVHVEQTVIMGYILAVLFMMSPIEVVMGWIPQIGRANVAFRKIESLGLLLAESEKEIEPATGPISASSWEQVEMANVTYVYSSEDEEHNFTLGPIDLRLCPGELTFLIGGNGSGKSTLAKVLAGLYVPQTGHITLDGKSITDENRVWYRQHFTAVFPTFFV
jgi:putative ATP-binding cassette transporter